MPFVKAQCMNCGGALEVDSNKEAAICPFCSTQYVVEKAIQNSNIANNGKIYIANATVVGESELVRLLNAARGYEKLGDVLRTLQTYFCICDRYPQSFDGWFGIWESIIKISIYHIEMIFANNSIVLEVLTRFGIRKSEYLYDYLNTEPYRNAKTLADSKQVRILGEAYEYYKSMIDQIIIDRRRVYNSMWKNLTDLVAYLRGNNLFLTNLYYDLAYRGGKLRFYYTHLSEADHKMVTDSFVVTGYDSQTNKFTLKTTEISLFAEYCNPDIINARYDINRSESPSVALSRVYPNGEVEYIHMKRKENASLLDRLF